jgi:hypothetical protein
VAKSRRAPDDDLRRRAEEDDDDAPRRKSRRDDDDDDAGDDGPIKPRRKKKSAAGPTKIVMRVIGAVLGAVAVIVFLVWVYSPVGADHSMLCYFPKETTQLSGYDVDEVMKNAKMTEVHQLLINNYKAFGDRRWSQDAGVKDTDVLKYMHGRAAGDPEEEKDLPAQQKRGELTVIRFRKGVDEAKFVGSFTGSYLCEEQQAKDGRKFYQLWRKTKVPPDWHEERDDDISFFFPNKTTLVYGTTRRETLEAMTRTPGKVVLEGNMRELADKVDGHYYTASGGWFEMNGVSNSMAFGLGFVDEEFRDQRKSNGVVGTASWFASNGNDFLYASANLYGDKRTASDVRRKLAAAYGKAQADIWQSESGKPSGLADPFNPPQPKGQAGGGMGMGGGAGGSSEQTKDIIDALAEYARSARVYNRGRLVIVEGLIPHGTPEQGTFEKLWHAISAKFQIQQPGGFGGPGGMMPPGGGPPPGMAPPPPGPGR